MGRSRPSYKLLDSDASDSSSSSSSSSSPSSFSSPIVFCIHGNKWGLATCCEDIDYQNSAEHEPMVSLNIYHSSKHQTKRQILRGQKIHKTLIMSFSIHPSKNYSWATRPWRRGVSARRNQHYIVTNQEGKGWMRGILSPI